MSFQGVDDILYTRLLQQAIQAGVTKDDNDRWKFGDLEFTMRRENGVLHITCTKKPFFVTCGMVAEKIQELISQAKEAA